MSYKNLQSEEGSFIPNLYNVLLENRKKQNYFFVAPCMWFPVSEDRANRHKGHRIHACKSYASILAHLILISKQ